MSEIVAALTKAMSSPRMVMRDKDGRIIGTKAGE
jgi:hypothetical protein